MGRERRTHRTQPMGGVAAAPREVRLTEPGGAEEPWRLLTRALGRERFKRECWGRIHLCCSFQPRLGFPSQVRVFYLYCLDPCWTSLSPGLSSALQTWEIPLLRAWALGSPQASDFHPGLSLLACDFPISCICPFLLISTAHNLTHASITSNLDHFCSLLNCSLYFLLPTHLPSSTQSDIFNN